MIMWFQIATYSHCLCVTVTSYIAVKNISAICYVKLYGKPCSILYDSYKNLDRHGNNFFRCEEAISNEYLLSSSKRWYILPSAKNDHTFLPSSATEIGRKGKMTKVYVWRDEAVWMCWILTDANHKKNHRQLGFKWN